MQVYSTNDTGLFIECLLGAPQHNEHCKAWRWHGMMIKANPGYLADIARRQAAKRAAGIGPEGRCSR